MKKATAKIITDILSSLLVLSTIALCTNKWVIPLFPERFFPLFLFFNFMDICFLLGFSWGKSVKD